MNKTHKIPSNTNIVTIYHDPLLSQYHYGAHGSLECPGRLKLNLNLYKTPTYKVVTAPIKTKYLFELNALHFDNPVLLFIQKNLLYPTFFQKLLNIKPNNLHWNCYQCTMKCTGSKCDTCGAIYKTDKFFLYAHLIDPKISDSDTTFITHTTINAIGIAVSQICQMVEDLYSEKTSHGFAIVRPPGHHASASKSEGFCIVNNVAIATNYAQKLGFKKIFIFDFDVHHGNGTQEIFNKEEIKTVFYCSIHTAEAYPKTGFDINNNVCDLVVQKKINDEDYLKIFNEKVINLIKTFHPNLILISAGFDGLKEDPMAIMSLTVDCYPNIILELKKIGVPIGMVLEGGYNLELMPTCIDKSLRALAEK